MNGGKYNSDHELHQDHRGHIRQLVPVARASHKTSSSRRWPTTLGCGERDLGKRQVIMWSALRLQCDLRIRVQHNVRMLLWNMRYSTSLSHHWIICMRRRRCLPYASITICFWCSIGMCVIQTIDKTAPSRRARKNINDQEGEVKRYKVWVAFIMMRLHTLSTITVQPSSVSNHISTEERRRG